MRRFLYKTILQNKLWLVQTDTTVGFLSQDNEHLAEVKERSIDKPFVQVTSSFKILKKLARVPNQHKRLVRRAKKTTFVYPNNRAIRVVKDDKHAKFITAFEWFYSTSANENSLAYTRKFACDKSDIIVEDSCGLYEGESSSIYRLYKTKIKRLR